MKRFQLMKGDSVENKESLRYPLFASPKIDGIRAATVDNSAVAFSLKKIPNKHIQKTMSEMLPEGLDGELTVGDPACEETYRVSESAVMSEDGCPNFTFHVFDIIDTETPYSDRLKRIKESDLPPFVKIVEQKLINDADELEIYENEMLMLGYEGVMVRDVEGAYKYGRSTVKQQYLLKVKRFVDSEAQVLEVLEKMHNNNPKKKNERGYTERSTKKAGKIPAGTMGKVHVRDIHTGVEFSIGTGFSDKDRDFFWSIRENEDLPIVKYKHFPKGVKDKPRHPVYLGIRNIIDIGVS